MPKELSHCARTKVTPCSRLEASLQTRRKRRHVGVVVFLDRGPARIVAVPEAPPFDLEPATSRCRFSFSRPTFFFNHSSAISLQSLSSENHRHLAPRPRSSLYTKSYLAPARENTHTPRVVLGRDKKKGAKHHSSRESHIRISGSRWRRRRRRRSAS